jgi:hypothetical protein
MHLMLCSCCATRMLTDDTVLRPAPAVLTNYELCPATVVLTNYEQVSACSGATKRRCKKNFYYST